MPELPDSAEMDALREMLRSPAWGLMIGRIHAEIDRRHWELEKPLDIEKTSTLRGLIAGLRIALNVPIILIDEIKAGLK